MTYLNKFKGIVEVKIRIMNFSLKFITTTKPIMKCYSKKMNAWFLIYALLWAKLTLLLIAWTLFWFVICVCYVSIWMFIVFFIFLVFVCFYQKDFMFCVHFILICFRVELVFSSQPDWFCFGSGTKTLFGWLLFLLRNFLLKGLFDKHILKPSLIVLFWIKMVFLLSKP
jgi:hypothetical protein